MRITSYFVRASRIALPLATGWMLARSLQTAPALALIALLSVLLPALGALLLRTSRPGEITWRNVAAGYCMPWGYKLGRGKLLGIAAGCAFCWCFLLLVGFGAGRPELARIDAGAEPSTFSRFLLALGWLLDGAALLYLLGLLRTSGAHASRSLFKLISICVLLLAVSVALALRGHMLAAAWIAAGPPLGIGLLYGAWVLVIVTVGRNARWN